MTIKFLMTSTKLYNDAVLSGPFVCSSEPTEIILDSAFRIERDRQMLGIKFKTPFAIAIDGDGGITDADGNHIDVYAYLIDADEEKYPLSFSGARGKRLGTYRSDKPLARDKLYSKLIILCHSEIEIEKLIWTTFSVNDMH